MNHEIIEAEAVPAPSTVDVYVLMIKFFLDGWLAAGTFRTEQEARDFHRGEYLNSQHRIVRVSGLPVDAPKGEV